MKPAHPTGSGIVTLTTDFGVLDPYVGVMKGVILTRAPACRIVDLTHAVPPQNVAYAAFCLASAAGYFPPGTVHVVVVDPEVGGPRRGLAVETARAFYVGPDNGVLTLALTRDPPRLVVELDRPEFWLPEVSTTFHGRDVFAPVAAAIATGTAATALGSPVEDYVRLSYPEPVAIPGNGLRGQILYVDHFGNCVTNIERHALPWAPAEAWVRTVDRDIGAIRSSYCAVPIGESVALFGSCGHLELAVRDRHAAQELDLQRGDEVFVSRGRHA